MPTCTPPELAYLVTDGTTGAELLARRASEPRAIGSLVKLMTARIALVAGWPTKRVTIPRLDVAWDESKLGLRPGERVRRDELLRATLVISANDAARALAVDIAGSETAFVALMNQEARVLGLRTTYFANPDGLDDSRQHSTARDLAVLGRVMMEDPTFRAIVATRWLRRGLRPRRATNDLLGRYAGADGIKTGHTSGAGWCIAASATREDRRVHVVVLGAPTEKARDTTATELLDWAFAQTPLSAAADGRRHQRRDGDPLGRIHVAGRERMPHRGQLVVALGQVRPKAPAVEHPDHVGHGDRLRRPGEPVAALPAPLGVDQPGPA